jgi:hypothetical protein
VFAASIQNSKYECPDDRLSARREWLPDVDRVLTLGAEARACLRNWPFTFRIVDTATSSFVVNPSSADSPSNFGHDRTAATSAANRISGMAALRLLIGVARP